MQEGRRQDSKETLTAEDHVSFVMEGGGRRNIRPRETPSPFASDQEWDMTVELDRQLCFPLEITTTPLHPDVVVWSTKARSVLLIELMVPVEDSIQAAFKRKKAKYSELAAECREAGWKAGSNVHLLTVVLNMASLHALSAPLLTSGSVLV